MDRLRALQFPLCVITWCFFVLQMMLKENKRVRAKIPSAFDPLMAPHRARVDGAIEPGLTQLTWTSVNIPSYMENVYAELSKLELMMDRVHDLMEFRIEAILKEMSKTVLCQIPDEEPWTVDHFLENTQVRKKRHLSVTVCAHARVHQWLIKSG